MTTVIILTAVANLCAYVFGWGLGYAVGKDDGYAEADEKLRKRCAR